jgi:hypothetical protein
MCVPAYLHATPTSFPTTPLATCPPSAFASDRKQIGRPLSFCSLLHVTCRQACKPGDMSRRVAAIHPPHSFDPVCACAVPRPSASGLWIHGDLGLPRLPRADTRLLRHLTQVRWMWMWMHVSQREPGSCSWRWSPLMMWGRWEEMRWGDGKVEIVEGRGSEVTPSDSMVWIRGVCGGGGDCHWLE